MSTTIATANRIEGIIARDERELDTVFSPEDKMQRVEELMFIAESQSDNVTDFDPVREELRRRWGLSL